MYKSRYMIYKAHVMGKPFELIDQILLYLYHICATSLFHSCPFSFRVILKLTNIVCVKSASRVFFF